jgi:Uma2 family endonuclease
MTIASHSLFTNALPPRKRFTRSEYHLLSENGFFEAEDRYELVEGDIVEKMGQKEPHIGLLMRWMAALIPVFGASFVRPQLPIVIGDDSEPEPDLSIAARSADAYLAAGETAPASEIRLIVEISVNTLAYDTGPKALLYAQGGVPDYWALDVTGRRLIVHRDPTAEGYASIVTLSEADSIAPLAAPMSAFAVIDYLP